MARFDFEGENSDELTFSEGDVIQLKAYIGQEWARGQRGASTGIFPLNFVEVIEDLPLQPSQQKRQSIRIALPGKINLLIPFSLCLCGHQCPSFCFMLAGILLDGTSGI